MHLYRDSEILRLTVTQELKQVILPEDDAPPNSYRDVQLLVPNEPTVYVSMLPNADVRIGFNRSYKTPPLRDSTTITIKLRPGQVLYAQAEKGIAEITGIIEYIVD